MANLSLQTLPPPASETRAGVVEFATQAEVNAGTVTDKVVTPATLAGWTGGGSQAHSGTSTIDFGATLNAIATLDITGQTGIQTTSDIQCWLQGTDSTADHNTYEHAIAAIRVTAMSIIAGTGFTLVAVGINTTFKGQWKVRWRWYD